MHSTTTDANSSCVPRRCGNSTSLLEVRLERIARLAGPVDRRVDEAGCDGVDAHADGGQVAGDRQGHPDDPALRCGVRGLTDLAVECGHRGDVDDGAALAVCHRLGRTHRRRDDANAIEAADQVDGDDLLERIEIGSRVVRAVLADRPLRPADSGRVHEDAHRTHALCHLGRVDDVVGVGDVDLAIRPTDLVGEGLALLLLEVRDQDLGAPRGEHACCRRPDSRCSTCDDCACAVDVHGRRR